MISGKYNGGGGGGGGWVDMASTLQTDAET